MFAIRRALWHIPCTRLPSVSQYGPIFRHRAFSDVKGNSDAKGIGHKGGIQESKEDKEKRLLSYKTGVVDGQFTVYYEPPLYTFTNAQDDRDKNTEKHRRFALGKEQRKRILAVTEFIRQYFVPFNAKKVSKEVLGNQTPKNKEWKYFDQTVETFREKWAKEGAPPGLNVENDVAVREYVELELKSLNAKVETARREASERRKREKAEESALQREKHAQLLADRRAKEALRTQQKEELKQQVKQFQVDLLAEKKELNAKKAKGEAASEEELLVVAREAELERLRQVALQAEKQATLAGKDVDQAEKQVVNEEIALMKAQLVEDKVAIGKDVEAATDSWENAEAVQKKIVSVWTANQAKGEEEGLTFHQAVEAFYRGEVFDPQRSVPELRHFFDWTQEQARNLIPYRAEWQVFDEDLLLAGKIDMAFLNSHGSNQVTLVDWKRIRKVSKWSNTYGRGPLEHVMQTSFNSYALQLHCYRKILEAKYGKQVTSMRLVVCHPENDRYKEMTVPLQRTDFLAEAIDRMFAERAAQLQLAQAEDDIREEGKKQKKANQNSNGQSPPKTN